MRRTTTTNGMAAIAAASCFILPSCSALDTVGTADSQAATRELREASVELFHQNVEFDKVEFHDPGFATCNLRDRRRLRTGARATWGVDWIKAQFELFHEDFLGSGDGAGFGIGASGRQLLKEFTGDNRLVFLYEVSGFIAGISDAKVRGREGDLGYGEGAVSAGLGLDIGGFRPSVGASFRTFEGSIDFDGEGDDDSDDDFDVDAVSGYVELGYLPQDASWSVSLRGLAGDEQGAYVGASWAF